SEPQFPTVLIGYRVVADILMPRSKLAAVALEKQRWCVRGLLNGLAHCAHVVGRDGFIFPGESRWVTRVIHECCACLSGRIRNSADQQCIVWVAIRIVATDDSLPRRIRIRQIAIGS